MKANRGVIASVLAVAVLATGAASVAKADEVKMKAGFFIGAKKSLHYRSFQRFVDKVNKDGKGLVQITQIVGPASISRRQWCNSVKQGIIDIAGIAQSYCNNLIPGSEGLNAATATLEEQRKNGSYTYVRELFAKHTGTYFYAQFGWGIHHHFFVNKPIKTVADFKGMRLRRTGTTKLLLAKLEAQGVSMGLGGIYTAVERGVIQGFALPLSVVGPLGLDKVAKYRIDPGVYNPAIMVLINLRTWNKLNAKQKAFMEKTALYLENEIDKDFRAANKRMGDRLLKSGVQLIQLSPTEAAKLKKLANDAIWSGAEKSAPDMAPKLRKLLMQ